MLWLQLCLDKYRYHILLVRLIKSRRLNLAGHIPRMGEDRSALNILTGKPTGNRHLGIYIYIYIYIYICVKWEGNIRMGLKEVGINMS